MQFQDTLIGDSLRNKLLKEANNLSRYHTKENNEKLNTAIVRLENTWVPVELIRRVLKSWARQQCLQIVRTQIPLVAANGMTIPKAQGSTIKGVVVSTRTTKGCRKLTREEIYVGCSRSPSAELLWIDGDFTPPDFPKDDDPVTLELLRLRLNPMPFTLKFFQDFNSSVAKLFFHNTQSLLAHYLDVEADQCIKNADVLALVEPHLLKSDKICLSGYTNYFRKDCQHNASHNPRNSEGILVSRKGRK